MEIKTLVTKAHENAVKHGFWEPPLPFGTAIALIHSELSEALEEERNGNPDIWFACNESDNFICTPQDETECLMYGKESLWYNIIVDLRVHPPIDIGYRKTFLRERLFCTRIQRKYRKSERKV